MGHQMPPLGMLVDISHIRLANAGFSMALARPDAPHSVAQRNSLFVFILMD